VTGCGPYFLRIWYCTVHSRVHDSLSKPVPAGKNLPQFVQLEKAVVQVSEHHARFTASVAGTYLPQVRHTM